MDTSPPSDEFEIISTLRSDEILLYSRENTLVNATIPGTLARSPVQFYMLSYHRDRMMASAAAFGWDTSPLEGPKGFSDLLHMLHDHLQSEYNDPNYTAPLMLRIAYSANGKFTITSNGPHPWPATIDQLPRPPHTGAVSQLYPRSLFAVADPILGASFLRWRVFVTFDKVTPTLFTRYKTSNRRLYDKALAILPAHPADLVLNGVQLQSEVLIVNDNHPDRSEIMEGCRFTPYFRRENEWITPEAECGGNLGTTRRWAIEQGLCKVGVVDGGSVKDNEIIVLSNGAKGFQSGIVKRWDSCLPNDPKQ